MFCFPCKRRKVSPAREESDGRDNSSSLQNSGQREAWSPSITTTPSTNVAPRVRKPFRWLRWPLRNKISPAREECNGRDDSSSLQNSVQRDAWSPSITTTPATNVAPRVRKPFRWLRWPLRNKRVFPHEDKEGTQEEGSTSDHDLRPLPGSNSPGLDFSAKPSSRSNVAIPNQELVCFGFPNLGMTCYMNSILQSVLNLDSFVKEIHNQLPVWSSHPGSQLFRCFLDAEVCRFTNVVEEKMSILSCFKWTVAEHNLEFDDNEQKDAHEFLICVLNIMRSVSSDLNLTAEHLGVSYTCPVVGHISLQVLNIRTCSGCGEQSRTVEDLVNLSLDLVPGGSVGQCLQEYFKENQIEYTCHCGARQSSLQSSFSTLPNVLILHLKRFTFTRSYTVKKIKSPIALSKELVVTEELMANKNATAHYSLVSVVSHMGSTADSGHYICDGIHRSLDMGDSADCWLTYDDERVSQTTAEDVCRHRVETAFLLFYEKQDTDSIRTASGLGLQPRGNQVNPQIYMADKGEDVIGSLKP